MNYLADVNLWIALVADQHVGPAAEDLEGDALVPTTPEEGDQFIEISGAGEKRSRATQSEPDPMGQRLIRLHGPGEVFE